jgi:hypothetical protein
MVIRSGKARFEPWLFGPKKSDIGNGSFDPKKPDGNWSFDPKNNDLNHGYKGLFGPEKSGLDHFFRPDWTWYNY